jgi:hypothetical protein
MRFSKTKSAKKPVVAGVESKTKFKNNDNQRKFNFDIVAAHK